MIDLLYDLIYILPLNLVAVLSCTYYWGKEDGAFIASLISTVFIVLLLILKHVGKKQRYFVSGIIAVILVGIFWVLDEEKKAVLSSQYNWLWGIVVIAFLCMVIGRLAQDIQLVKLLLVVAILINVIYLLVTKQEITRLAPALSWVMILIYLVEVIQRHWNKSGYTDIHTHTALIASLLVALSIVVVLIPTPEEPYDWRFAKEIWRATVTEYKRIVGMIKDGNDEYADVGFGENTEAAGTIKTNSKEVMRLTCNRKYYDRIYLGGVTYEDFYGDRWDSDIEGSDDGRMFDLLETKCAIRKSSEGYDRDYLAEDTLQIDNLLFNTKHIFLPSKVNLESDKTIIPRYVENANRVLTKNRLRYGDGYTLSFNKLNFANENLWELFGQAEPITKEEWDEILRVAFIKDKERYSYDNYLIYKAGIYEKYTDAQGMSEQLQEVIDEAIGDVEGDYYRLSAVAQYLQTMEYNTKPGLIPEDVDDASSFLDYFVLEQRSGYCIHYATAMATLARELGYPARYVQGYYIKKGNSDELVITQKSAHAWAEIYFDNFGWVVFEATPGYSQSKGWAVGGRVDITHSIPQMNAPVVDTTQIPQLDELPAEAPKRAIKLSYIVIPLVSAVAFAILYLAIYKLIEDIRYRRMGNEAKLVYMTRKTMRILQRLGYRLNPYETIDEYHDRIVEAKENIPEGDISFLMNYSRLLYSDYDVGDEAVKQIEQSFVALRKELISRKIRARENRQKKEQEN